MKKRNSIAVILIEKTQSVEMENKTQEKNVMIKTKLTPIAAQTNVWMLTVVIDLYEPICR